jgi:hypothetical protein
MTDAIYGGEDEGVIFRLRARYARAGGEEGRTSREVRRSALPATLGRCGKPLIAVARSPLPHYEA